MKSPVRAQRSSSQRSTGWIPWVLVIVVGLFLAWRFWLGPMILGKSAGEGTEAQSAVSPPVKPAGGDGGMVTQAGGAEEPVGSLAVTDSAETSPAVTDTQTVALTQNSVPLQEDAPDSAALQDSLNLRDPEDLSSRFLVGKNVAEGLYRGELTGQVASIRGQERADQLLQVIRSLTGLRGVAVSSQVNGQQWYRILVGRFARVDDAMEALAPLLRRRLVTEVMVIPAPAGLLDRLSGSAP